MLFSGFQKLKRIFQHILDLMYDTYLYAFNNNVFWFYYVK